MISLAQQQQQLMVIVPEVDKYYARVPAAGCPAVVAVHNTAACGGVQEQPSYERKC